MADTKKIDDEENEKYADAFIGCCILTGVLCLMAIGICATYRLCYWLINTGGD